MRLPAPCCGGQSLQGVRASITVPNSISLPTNYQVLASVLAGGDPDCGSCVVYTIFQIGFEQDNNVALQNLSCDVNQVIYWIEDDDDGGNNCYNLGVSSGGGATHKFSVMRVGTWLWQAFMDGVPPGGGNYYNHNIDDNSDEVQAGGEIACGGGVSCQNNPVVFDRAYFGSPGSTPWQRYNPQVDWYTIQNQSPVYWCNGTQCGGAGGWSHDMSQFPTTWSVTH